MSAKTSDLRFYIATWNVSTRYPEKIILDELLSLEKNNEANEADFYIIGLQEVNANPQNSFFNLFKDDPWTQKFKDLLKNHDYILIKAEQMQGLLLCIFAKKKHILHLREIEADYTRTGIAGIWGNKGAITLTINIYGNTFCIVNAHLAAHDHQLDERVSDYERIVEESKFHIEDKEAIFDHDYVFWFGDLNFRLTGESMSPEEILEIIKKDELQKLINKDQLVLVRKEGRAFRGLEEKLPMFPPTFKFEPGTRDYDMKRRPAWTDRILYRVDSNRHNRNWGNLGIKQESYKSHPNYDISDHKPVTSEFMVKVNENESEKIVEFSPIDMWYVGENMIVDYTLPPEFENKGADWIGIYKEDFNSLVDYISWEYTENYNDTEHDLNEQQLQIQRNKRKYTITFSEDYNLPLDHRYQLLYFQSTGTRGVTGLVGMSNVFSVQRRRPTLSFDDID